MIFPKWLRRKDPDKTRFDRLAKRLESPIEYRFWAHAYAPLSALGRLTPQTNTKEGYRVDFTLTNIPGVDLLRVAIELDGHDYHSSQDQRNYDTARGVCFLSFWLRLLWPSCCHRVKGNGTWTKP